MTGPCGSPRPAGTTTCIETTGHTGSCGDGTITRWIPTTVSGANDRDVPGIGRALTPEQAATAARFEAAAPAPETHLVVVAMLALAEDLDGFVAARGEPAKGSFDHALNMAHAHRHAADRIRAALSAALAADPEPREAVVERAARAAWAADANVSVDEVSGPTPVPYRRLAAAALDAAAAGPDNEEGR